MTQTAGTMAPRQLRRELGLFGAVMMGLGSIIGTGVFVSIGIAAGAAGPAVVLAIGLAGLVATCNGLNSAQLAANHPVSGGTYEYGYRYLNPMLGFLAGWTFLLAKSASAATAALGFAGYLLNALGRPSGDVRAVGLMVLAALTAVVLAGMRRSHRTNVTIVSVTLAALAFFILAGLPAALRRGGAAYEPFFAPVTGEPWLPGLLRATALMFVAYTGYGRIATLGEEVREPRRTIPRAIAVTLLVSAGLYVGVALVGIGVAGADAFWQATRDEAAPLEVVSRSFGMPAAPYVLAVGAITAMLGVLLNLLLGLSRMLLAMARRRDMPGDLARLNEAGTTPTRAVTVIALAVAALVLIGDVRVTWSFSAFTVLIYYAVTNLAALRLPRPQRLYPRALAVLGLAACLFLAFWVDRTIWLVGLALLGLGVIWHLIAARLRRAGAGGPP